MTQEDKEAKLTVAAANAFWTLHELGKAQKGIEELRRRASAAEAEVYRIQAEKVEG